MPVLSRITRCHCHPPRGSCSLGSKSTQLANTSIMIHLFHGLNVLSIDTPTLSRGRPNRVLGLHGCVWARGVPSLAGTYAVTTGCALASSLRTLRHGLVHDLRRLHATTLLW